jgi:hypothetical protein
MDSVAVLIICINRIFILNYYDYESILTILMNNYFLGFYEK